MFELESWSISSPEKSMLFSLRGRWQFLSLFSKLIFTSKFSGRDRILKITFDIEVMLRILVMSIVNKMPGKWGFGAMEISILFSMGWYWKTINHKLISLMIKQILTSMRPRPSPNNRPHVRTKKENMATGLSLKCYRPPQRLFRPLLRHVYEYIQYKLFQVCGSTREVLYHFCGSAPNSLIFCQWEYLLYML